MTLRELYESWRNATMGRWRRCPGCQKTLPIEKQVCAYRYNAADKRVRIPGVIYCGLVECLHVIWDMREVILMKSRERLDRVLHVAGSHGIVLGPRPVDAGDGPNRTRPRRCCRNRYPHDHCTWKCFGDAPSRPYSRHRYTDVGWTFYYARRHRRVFVWKSK